MKALGSGNRQRNQLQIPHGIFADRVMSPSRDGRYRRRGPLHLCEHFLRNTSCQCDMCDIPASPAMTTPGSARASRSITPLQINQLEIDETIPKRANYIPMHSKVTAVAIFYCWTGNPNDGQQRRGRKSKWAGAAGVGRPRRDRWRQRAADASRQTLSRTV
ncbi:hypothetical protein B0H14DRAFT_2827004, partial [Mycena olivaceomarginata]